jgi:hypothetical protein
VRLQVEEDVQAAVDELAHEVRTVRRVRLETDLDHGDVAGQTTGQIDGCLPFRQIQGDDETLSRLHC